MRIRSNTITLSIILTTLITTCIYAGFSESTNPDWLGYKEIYENSGSWLALQGRDVLFLRIIDISKYFFYENGYEVFRMLLAVYFIAFTFMLCNGWVIKLKGTVDFGVLTLMTVSIINLAATRFVIQVREGLAITLIALLLGLLTEENLSRSKIIKMVLYGTAALLLHAGTVVIIAAIIAGFMIKMHRSAINRALARVDVTFAIMVLATVFVSFVAVMGGSGISDMLQDDRYFDSAEYDVVKLVYWLLYGVVLIVVYKYTKITILTINKPVTREMFYLLSGPISASVYLCIVVLIIFGGSVATIGVLVRMLNMLLAINLLFYAFNSNAFKSKFSWSMFVSGLFMIFNQARVYNTFLEN